jgi:hypothetical protein
LAGLVVGFHSNPPIWSATSRRMAATMTLAEAVRAAAAKAYVILDGTLVWMDRVADQRPYYSGKHKRHGVNVQVLADALGRLIWASPALPGSTHDLTAARTHGLVDALTEAEGPTLADKGYQGAGGTVRTPFKGRHLPKNMRAVNRAHAQIRAVGEQAVATIKTWRILRRLRCSPTRISTLVAAVLTLHLQPTAGRWKRLHDTPIVRLVLLIRTRDDCHGGPAWRVIPRRPRRESAAARCC